MSGRFRAGRYNGRISSSNMFPIFRINLKPLIPKDAFKVDTAKVLRSTQREILRAIRSEITAQPFSRRAKQALATGMTTRVQKSSVLVIARHPAFLPLIQGKKKQQMKWLTKAVRPIPIVLDSGEVIFRNATPRSMSAGRWYHPGHKKTNVLDKAREKARGIVRDRLQRVMLKQMRMTTRSS